MNYPKEDGEAIRRTRPNCDCSICVSSCTQQRYNHRMIDAVQIRFASLNEIIALRADVLIGGTDRGSAAFDGDDATDTKHFGAFIGSTNVACASCMRSDREDAPAWQLRGMATHADHQSLGIGAQLLAFIEAEYATLAALLWCNARTGAVAFYERAGWRCTSEVFEIAGVGPHREMVRLLGPGR